MKRLEGRTALVTGAGIRVGAAIAERLAQEGADVVVHYRTSEGGAQETARAVEAAGQRAWLVQADLGDPEVPPALITEAAKAAGRPLDILVNNASIFPKDTIDTATYASFDENLRVNAWAPFALTRGFAEQVEGDGDACVVNLIDARVDDDPQHAAYILSKKLLLEMTRMQAAHFAPKIRVNGIAPGPILPGPGMSTERFETIGRMMPLGHHGDPAWIAEATAYLCSALYTTGDVLYVDGGRHLMGRSRR